MKLDMRTHNTPGLLITFCGLDGCGKTTIIRMLENWLVSAAQPPFLTKQPTDFVRSSAIFRTYMDEPDHNAFDYRSLSLLCASDRVQHTNRVIMPRLQRGETVISDRYFYSCLANLRARGYTSDRWIYEVAQSIPRPDLAFFLDIPAELAVKRVRSRPAEKNRYIDMELQSLLREEYRRIALENGGILLSSIQDSRQTFEHILQHVQDYLGGQYGIA